MQIKGYREVWGVDFEYEAVDGERPRPVCMVAIEFGTGRAVRWWRDQLEAAAAPPYPTDAGVLVVAYYAAGDLSCHLALGWPGVAPGLRGPRRSLRLRLRELLELACS